MKKYIFISLILLTTMLQAQNPQFEWVKTNQGNQGNSDARYFEQDSIGNNYTIGLFSGTIDFNPSPSQASWLSSAYGKTSFYIQKLDSSGNFLWVRQIDFASGSKLYQFCASPAGRLYITGSFKDSVDIDPGTSVNMLYSNGGSDGFILKLSSNGNFIWARSFGGPDDDYFRDIKIDKRDNVYTHGSFQDSVDFDPGPANSSTFTGGEDAFILKLDKNGDFVWVKHFESGESYSDGIALDLDSKGNVYCVGDFFGNGIDFDPGTGTAAPPVNSSYMYFVKLDSMGSFVWARFNTAVYIGQGSTIPRKMVVDRFNNIFITGITYQNIDFDPGPDTLLLAQGTFIEKYDQDGNYQWAKSYGYGNEPLAMATDTFGNVYSTGHFNDSTDLDPGVGNVVFYTHHSDWWNYGAYFQKLNSNGDFLSGGVFRGNSGHSSGYDISLDDAGNMFLVGEFVDTVDFDPGLGIYNLISVHPPWNSSYLVKLSQSHTLTTDYITTCDSLTWMDGKTYYQSTNSAYYTLPSAAGCDSVIVLNLTVPEIDNSVNVSTTGIFSSNQNNASYQWLDCDNNLSILAGDTNQIFTPTQNGNYAVALNVSGCVDTSNCVSIQNVGMESLKLESSTIKVYPNPNTGSFMLDLGNMHAEQVSIINSMGQVVYTAQDVKSQLFNLDLIPGVYLVKVHNEKEIQRMKFVVK